MVLPSALRSDALAGIPPADRPATKSPLNPLQASPLSGISWGAILAGAAGAAALSLMLLILGTGLGLSVISPWSHEGIGAQGITATTIAWVTFTQLLAAGLGGYLAGRLRGQWLDLQTDEIYFRDTAHGFLAWAIASLASAALLGAAIASIVGGSVQAGAGVAKAAAEMAPMNYVVESLFRQPPNTPPAVSTADRGAVTSEVTSIFMNTVHSGALQSEDQRYVGRLVAQRTGLGEPQAEERVRDAYLRAQAALRDTETHAREVADKARKASAYAALWLFIALLSGAFTASLAATFGGRQRDL